MIIPDEVARKLSERSGKHLCVRCLAEVPAERFLELDHVCERCAADDEYPLASTAEEKPDPQSPGRGE